jgi:hypothetical protein
MTAGRLSERVAALCDRGLETLPAGVLQDRIKQIRDSLHDPLRVAVAGRVKAGKSTLVNALVREHIAPTGVGEVTKVVTWFRYGFPERVTVVPRSGTPWDTPLGTTYALPEALGADPEAIARVVVTLSIEALRSMTIIDTPGLASANVAYSEATREMLAIDDASRDAVSDADAVVYVIAHGAAREDAEALMAIRRTGGGPRASAVHSLGVLSKVDLLDGDDGTPERLAMRQAELLRSMVATVVPVTGLLAETAETGAFHESDARALVQLAGLIGGARERMLLGADRFRAVDAGLDAATKERLLLLLDLRGIAIALAAIDGGATDATRIVRALAAASGIQRLRELLEETFGARADALKADRALLALERLSFSGAGAADAPAQRALRNEIERLRLEPETHALRQIRALQECLEAEVGGIPEDLERELRRLLDGSTIQARVGVEAGAGDDEVERAAAAGANRWRSYVNDGQATSAAIRVADVVAQSYEYAWAEATGSLARS